MPIGDPDWVLAAATLRADFVAGANGTTPPGVDIQVLRNGRMLIQSADPTLADLLDRHLRAWGVFPQTPVADETASKALGAPDQQRGEQ